MILRQRGASLALIGSLALLSSPWLLKFLWAPATDRYWIARLGRRRSWLAPAQAAMIAATLAFARVDLAADLLVVSILFVLLNVAAATQDVAVDGLAVDVLEPSELAAGNGVQVMGFKLGNIAGGGVLLALSDRLTLSQCFHLMAGLLALSLLVVLATDETRLYRTGHAPLPREPVLPLLAAAVRAQPGRLAAVLFLAKFCETFGGAMLKPFLVDAGFTRGDIGRIDGIAGATATLAGAAAGVLAARRLGVTRTLALAIAAQGAMLVSLGVYAAFGAYAGTAPGWLGITILNAMEHVAGGAVGVAVFALAMAACDPRVGAGQFTLQQCLYMSGSFVANPLSGAASSALGYAPVFATGGAMALLLAAAIHASAGSLVPQGPSAGREGG